MGIVHGISLYYSIEGGPMGAQEGKFLPLLHTKMYYPGVGEKKP